jgi:hypothetical protein
MACSGAAASVGAPNAVCSGLLPLRRNVDDIIRLELERARLPGGRPLQKSDFNLKCARVTAEEPQAALPTQTRYY